MEQDFMFPLSKSSGQLLPNLLLASVPCSVAWLFPACCEMASASLREATADVEQENEKSQRKRKDKKKRALCAKSTSKHGLYT